MKQKVYDDDLGRYVWQAENIADGSQTNINQLDIAINKGEKVEIKVRSISEAGYPENPLRSPWSNSIIMEFPDTLATSNQIADLITMVNDDALTLTIQNNLESIGVTEHLNDTIPNSNSVNGMYYKHIANNIAYEETGINDNGTTVVNSISLQDKVEKIDAQSAEARKIAAENAQNILNISTNMQKEHGRYNTSINQLEDTTELLSEQVEDISTDVHSFVSINRDDDGNAHPVLSAKEYVLVDDTNNEKAAMILDGTAVKLTNNLANPKDSANLARLFVEDVYLKSMNASTLNQQLYEINTSLGTKAFQSQVDQINASVNQSYVRLDQCDQKIAKNSDLISDLSTNVASFWDRSRKRLGADVIRVGITGQTTYLKSSTEG